MAFQQALPSSPISVSLVPVRILPPQLALLLTNAVQATSFPGDSLELFLVHLHQLHSRAKRYSLPPLVGAFSLRLRALGPCGLV